MKRSIYAPVVAVLSLLISGCNDEPIYKIEVINVTIEDLDKAHKEFEEKGNISQYSKVEMDRILYLHMKTKYAIKMSQFFRNIGFSPEAASAIAISAIDATRVSDTLVKDPVSDETIQITSDHYREVFACFLTEGRLYALVANMDYINIAASINNLLYHRYYESIRVKYKARVTENMTSSEKSNLLAERDAEFYERVKKRYGVDGKEYIQEKVYARKDEYFKVVGACAVDKVVLSGKKYTKLLPAGITLPRY